jgi:hypothetical protein
MTREERELAIEELQGCIIAEEHGKDGKPNGNVTCELTKGTIDLAIKALEQEPILDKIRAQFKSHLRGVEITLEVLVENDPLRPKMEGAKETLEECLEIIDKAETEEK